MNSQPSGCAGDGCISGLDTWPLHHIRQNGVLCRLCSSCLLLSYRSIYCCCCFFLLGPEPPTHFDDGDDLLAPPIPTATCQVCNEAVAHRFCLQSADSTFVCPACVAVTEDRPFSYAPPCMTPLDMRSSRIVLLAARVALVLLQKEATAARAMAERLYREAAAEKARACRALAVALGLDPELPAANEYVPPPLLLHAPPENLASGSSVADMGMEPPDNPAPEGSMGNMGMAPPENLPSEGSVVTMALGLDLNAPPPWTPAAQTIGAGYAEELDATEAARRSSPPPPPPPPRTLQLFWDGDKRPDDEGVDM